MGRAEGLGMPDFVCPQCGSGRLRRSHTRGVSEKLHKVFGWRAYRCREKSCGWRGLLKTRSFRQEIAKTLKNHKILILKLILVVAVLSIGIFLVVHFNKHVLSPAPKPNLH
jgi:predicted RNA-binding Zn-ribbon protein involved in translation (DUF1610 family)